MDIKEYLANGSNLNRKKVTRREEYTINMIQEAFLGLLQKHSIEKITVAELCEKANVNRSTFYRHYEDIYSLLDAIAARCHREMFYNIIDTVSFEPDFDEIGYNYILKVCEITEKNKELYKLLLFGKTPTNLLDRLADSSFKLYTLAHTDKSFLKPIPEMELHYKYLIYGMLGVWTSWIREDCKWPKEMVADVVRNQISGFFARMNHLYGIRK